MDDDLTVPETLKLLAQHEVTTQYNVWSDTYRLPPGSVPTGWEMVEIKDYGWIVRRRQDGRETTSAAYAKESEACAALLQGLLEPDHVARPPDHAAFESLLARWRCTPWRRSVTTRAGLREALRWLGVPTSAFSLYGGRSEGRLCLEERVAGWRVFQVRSGRLEAEQRFAAEASACQEFWQRLVGEELPTLMAVQPPLVAVPAAVPADREDDLTLPEALDIWRRNGWKPEAVYAPSYGIELPPERFDDVVSMHELRDGRWESRYTERGQSRVVAEYAREGDACAAMVGMVPSLFASAARDKLASQFETTPYEQLLHYWRLRPWRASPGHHEELVYALRDYGFPRSSYNLAGGRGADVLTMEQRLDCWRVYQVQRGRRVNEVRHHSAAAACAAFWQRAVDEVLPDLIATGRLDLKQS